MGIVIYPELPANTWSLNDWLEEMAQRDPGGASSFTNQDSEASMVIQVPGNKVRSCINQILGFSWADDYAPYQLHRERVPIGHPYYGFLWADSVSVAKHTPLAGYGTYNTGEGKAKLYCDTGFAGNTVPAYLGAYALADVTVHFKPLKQMVYVSDFDNAWSGFIGEEWARYFGRIGTDIGLDLIAVEGATEDSGMTFAEGTVPIIGTGSGPVFGPKGQTFGGAVFTRKQVTKFHMLWKQVPLNYTCGPIDFTPALISSFIMPSPLRLTTALGRLNSVPFPGTGSPYLPGTLMLTAVKETVYQQPVLTNSKYGYPAADYEMTFEYFDPPRDPAAVQNTSVGFHFGHELFPYRQTRYWYYATAGSSATRGTASGKAFYPTMDFHDIFQSLSNIVTYPLPTG